MRADQNEESDWPFSDPKNVATITLRQILEEDRPVLYVTHDVEDGCWQFMDGNDAPDEKDGRVVCLDDGHSRKIGHDRRRALKLGRIGRDDLRRTRKGSRNPRRGHAQQFTRRDGA